jgi:hypothetical protein
LLKLSVTLTVVVAALAAAWPAAADDWLPHPTDATWTYQWTDSVYNTTPTNEKVTVKEQKGSSFTLQWTTQDQGNPDDAPQSVGQVIFQETQSGLLVADWASSPPPSTFPIMCSAVAQCGNSLSSSLYNLIWGSRTPLLIEPLLQGASWNGVGGAKNDVSSTSDVAGVENVTVPAFPTPVQAVKITSQITQAGAIGDPYGSGIRTVWWVFGVGPVKMTFEHSGGASPPVTTVVLNSTNQAAKPLPTLADYFPLRKGWKAKYRWTNTKHFTKPEVESFTVDQVLNGSARVTAQSVSGPMKVAGAYGFTSRLDGVTNIWGLTRAASLAKLPPLGPSALPKQKRRHFFTPFDLMTFGFNPVIPAYPASGNTWTAKTSGRDWETYGVTGTTTVLGVQKVTTPAGSFQALAVRSVLVQPGFPFGSGTRTSWFAPKRGLVKLEFRHADKSVSVVELLH